MAPQSRPVKIAVIGLGAMGQTHLGHIKSSHNFQLIGVHDQRWEVTKRVADSSASKPYDQRRRLFGRPRHRGGFRMHAAPPAGRHRPGGAPSGQAPARREANGHRYEVGGRRHRTGRQKRGLVVSVNYSRVFTDAVGAARRLMEQGVVGELIGIETRWNGYKAPGYYHGAHSPTSDDWRIKKNKAGGGMVIMTTCHALHFVQHITGARVTSAAAVVPPSVVSLEVEDTLQGVMQLDCGASWAVLTSSSQRGIGVNDTTIWGGNGTIVLQTDRVRYYSTRIVEGRRPGAWHEIRERRSQDHFGRWLDDTARAIRREKDLEVSAESARDTLAVIGSLYQSARSGSSVDVSVRAQGDRAMVHV